MHLDLDYLFDWNVKQLFLYLIAEYITPANVSWHFNNIFEILIISCESYFKTHRFYRKRAVISFKSVNQYTERKPTLSSAKSDKSFLLK